MIAVIKVRSILIALKWDKNPKFEVQTQTKDKYKRPDYDLHKYLSYILYLHIYGELVNFVPSYIIYIYSGYIYLFNFQLYEPCSDNEE